MSTNPVYRYRIRYSKDEAVRYISHLDLQRTWERIFRRAAIPLAFTQGFHPHPRLNLGLALALGWTSECELLDVWLSEEISPEDLERRLSAALPPSLPIHSITQPPSSSPKPQKQIRAASYRAVLPEGTRIQDVQKRIGQFLSEETVKRERRGKTYDLRPLVISLEYVIKDNQPGELLMTLSAKPSATGRPDEVLLALSIDPLSSDIRRTALVLNK
jgi:radical SAM-linked protein